MTSEANMFTTELRDHERLVCDKIFNGVRCYEL